MTSRGSVRDKRIVAAGAVLIASAAVLGTVGLALEAMAVVSTMRRRIADMNTPPRELARRNWARSAATVRAAGDAWRRKAGPVDQTAGV